MQSKASGEDNGNGKGNGKGTGRGVLPKNGEVSD